MQVRSDGPEACAVGRGHGQAFSLPFPPLLGDCRHPSRGSWTLEEPRRAREASPAEPGHRAGQRSLGSLGDRWVHLHPKELTGREAGTVVLGALIFVIFVPIGGHAPGTPGVRSAGECAPRPSGPPRPDPRKLGTCSLSGPRGLCRCREIMGFSVVFTWDAVTGSF